MRTRNGSSWMSSSARVQNWSISRKNSSMITLRRPGAGGRPNRSCRQKSPPSKRSYATLQEQDHSDDVSFEVFLNDEPKLVIVHITLHEVVFHVHPFTLVSRLLVADIRYHDDGAIQLFFFHGLHHAMTIQHRHEEIEEYNIRQFLFHSIKRFLPIVGDGDAYAVLLDNVAHNIGDELGIFSDEDVFALCTHGRRGGERCFSMACQREDSSRSLFTK